MSGELISFDDLDFSGSSAQAAAKLGKVIADAGLKPGVSLRQGVVSAVNLTVTPPMVGPQFTVNGVPCYCLSSVGPQVGDTVWYTQNGPDWLIVGGVQNGWVTAGFSLSAGFSLGGLGAKARFVGGLIEVRFQITRTGATMTASAVGNFADTNAMTIPSQFAPLDQLIVPWQSSVGGGTGRITTGGVFQITDGYSNMTISSGDNISVTSVFGAN